MSQPRHAPINWRTDKPDEGELVLLRIEDSEEPIIPAFIEAGQWHYAASAIRIVAKVIGYMSLEDAATKLDREDKGR